MEDHLHVFVHFSRFCYFVVCHKIVIFRFCKYCAPAEPSHNIHGPTQMDCLGDYISALIFTGCWTVKVLHALVEIDKIHTQMGMRVPPKRLMVKI